MRQFCVGVILMACVGGGAAVHASPVYRSGSPDRAPREIVEFGAHGATIVSETAGLPAERAGGSRAGRRASRMLAPPGMQTDDGWREPERVICRPFGWGGACRIFEGDGRTEEWRRHWTHLAVPLTVKYDLPDEQGELHGYRLDLRFRSYNLTRLRIDEVHLWTGGTNLGRYPVPGRAQARRAAWGDAPANAGRARGPTVQARAAPTQTSLHALGGERYRITIDLSEEPDLNAALNISMRMAFNVNAGDRPITVEDALLTAVYK